jgi:triphosphatase
MEIELKLTLAAEHADALKSHPLLQAHTLAPATEHELDDTYYDTADLRILRSGAGLRVRLVDGVAIQTMKAGGSVEGGLHSRHEWESRVAGPVPELDQLRALVDAKGPWAKLLRSESLADALTPVFTVRITRTLWLLRLPEGSEVEFALDQGEIESRSRRLPISEIELELKSGLPEHLFSFALALHLDLPLRVGQSSKAERGYGLFEPRPWQAAKAKQLRLSKEMTVEQAAQAMLGNCLRQIQANQPGVALGKDVEGLHQMRVGLRRLRSALGMLKTVIDVPPVLADDIAWLASELGPARDWDVLAGTTLPSLMGEDGRKDGGTGDGTDSEPDADTEGLPAPGVETGGHTPDRLHVAPKEGAAPAQQDRAERSEAHDCAVQAGLEAARAAQDRLRRVAQRRADELRARAGVAVAGSRYTGLVLRITRWLLGREWRAGLPPAQLSQLDSPIPRFADRLLARQHKRLLKRGKQLTQAEPAALHRVRVAAKKNRYGTEFFQSLYPGRRVRSYLAALSSLQDELGWANDAAVAGRLLHVLPADQSGLAEAAAYACGYLAAQLQGRQKSIDKKWRRFRVAKLPS